VTTLKNDIQLQFVQMVWEYYGEHGRDLPWRHTTDPYRILVSEIMLQQTQVDRVKVKYTEFLKRFPNIQTLADASIADVLAVWSGLGYNRRALYLKKTAEIIVDKYDGIVPRDRVLLHSFPGIGSNTAGAILAYSFNDPVVFIETNIRRVFLHHFFSDQVAIDDKEIIPLIEQTLPDERAREWYWALMDYGTYLAITVVNPNQRSKHYNKQSKFEGSRRQLRGILLRELADGSKSFARLRAISPEFTEDMLQKVLADLETEGFIVRVGRSYQLA